MTKGGAWLVNGNTEKVVASVGGDAAEKAAFVGITVPV